MTRRLMITQVALLLAAQWALVVGAAADQISVEQRARLNAEIANVPAELRSRFDELYQDWRKTRERADIAVSSSTGAVRNSEEFRALVSLGPKVLPLIVNKLLEPSEFFALQVYEAIEKPNLGEEYRFESEQKRAIAVARGWLSR
jgi:hypothetical protein